MKCHSGIFRVAAFLITTATTMPAQQAVSSATLSGIVQDSSGAAIVGSTVSVRHLDRDQMAKSTTDSSGRYHFLYLAPGDYRLKVEDARFAVFERTLTLGSGQAVNLPIALSLPGQNTSIVVNESLVTMETVRTQVSDIVKTKEVDSLPLNGRNYLDLALLVPGVSRTNTGSPQQFAETSAVPGTGISFASQRNLNNNFVLDGLSMNDDAAGLSGTFFSQEVIREFQVVNSGGTAEFGRASSGVLNISSKSGSNEFHGRAYGFVRNQRFDARNALATRKDPLTQLQYGLSFGGPVKKGRTFFFSNFEQGRRNAAGFVTISQANVDAINQALSNFQLPTRINTGEFSTGWKITNFFGRADHQINSANQLFVRYSLYDIASPNSRSAGGLNDISRATRLDNRDQSIAISEVAAISPRLLNEVRFQFSRSNLSAPGNDLIGPAVSISGVANFGASTTSPVGRDNDLYQLNDTLSFTGGNHAVRLGADLLWNRLNIFFPGSQIAAVYSFSSLANFQAGRYQTFQQAYGDPNQFQSNPNFGFFFQDEWKVRPGLTLQTGLRYDIQRLPNPIQTDYNNVAPRFGIAWSPAKTLVVRANYGLFYDRIPLRATSNALQRDGSKYRVALLSFGQQGAPTFPRQLPEFPAGQYINITTIDFNIQNSYSQQASLQIEKQFGSAFSVSAGYQWLRGLHLILSRNVNVPQCTAAEGTALGIPNLCRPDSRYGNVSRFEGSGDSYYNGFLLAVRARPAKRAEIRLSYNLSKGIDNTGNFFFSSPQNNFNLRDDRGLTDNDQRHRLTFTAVLDSPVARGSSWAGRLFADWQLSPLLLYTSQLPFNVLLGSDRNNDTNTNDRPIGVGRNTGRGFDYFTFDLRLSRMFRITERVSLQGIAEAFNLLNRTNFAVPNNTYGPNPTPLPAFGQPTVTNDARQLQFALRVNF